MVELTNTMDKLSNSTPASIFILVYYAFINFQQEENNNIPSDCDGATTESTDDSHYTQKSAQAILEMRKYTMAAANPILAEKLSTPSEPNLQPLSTASRTQLAPLTPKIERGIH